MIQAYLDSIKENAAQIAIQYTNGRMEAMLLGKGNFEEIADDCLRVIYLWGVINNVYLEGTTPYIGGTSVTDEYVADTRNKLYHYNGIFDYVDLAETVYDEIIPDDGEEGSCNPSPQTGDHYRSDTIAVVSGTNIITFTKNGVVSPLPSADYTLQVWVQLDSGYVQHSLQISDQVAGGFVANDVTGSGQLSYLATLDT